MIDKKLKDEEDAPKILAQKQSADRARKEQEAQKKQAEEDQRIMEKNKQDLEDRQDPSGAKRIKAKLDEENAKLFGIKKTDVEKLYD